MRKYIAANELESLLQNISRLYGCLNRDPVYINSAYKVATRVRKFCFNKYSAEMANHLNENVEWFIERGSKLLADEKELNPNGGEGALEQGEDSLDVKQQLMNAIEEWYAWLSFNQVSLFNTQDATRMKTPVVYFHKANEWLSRTTMINADWFFEKGSEVVMNRWLKGDYDSYE